MIREAPIMITEEKGIREFKECPSPRCLVRYELLKEIVRRATLEEDLTLIRKEKDLYKKATGIVLREIKRMIHLSNYMFLKAKQEEGIKENLTKLIRTGGKLTDCAGLWSDMPKKEFAEIKNGIEKARKLFDIAFQGAEPI